MMIYLLNLFLLFVGLYLAFYSFQWLLLSFIGLFPFREKIRQPSEQVREWLIVVPAYRPSQQLFEVLESIRQYAPAAPYRLLVLLQETGTEFALQCREAFPEVIFLERSFSAEKGNPYHFALHYISRQTRLMQQAGKIKPSHVVLLDKDNTVDADFFKEMNRSARWGYELVQGRRAPQTVETLSEAYDSLAEALNDHLYRRAKFRKPFSPELSGSGIMFTIEAFHFGINSLNGKAPGMDKYLMIRLLTAPKLFRIAYNERAVVYDEKTAALEALGTQRGRWFAEQYFNALYYGKALWKATLTKGRWQALDYWLTLWRPPRSLHLMLLPVLAMAEWLTAYFANLYYLPFSGLGLVMTLLAVVVFLGANALWKEALQICFRLPLFAWHNLLSSIKGMSKKNEGKFVHTPHDLNKSFNTAEVEE